VIAALVRGPVGRLVPLGIILLALQTTLFVEVQPVGVVLQIVLAFAAAAGAVGGPERGALAGFVLGLMFDLVAGSPLGSSAITMGLAGALAGCVMLFRVELTWWLAAFVVTLAAGAGELAVPAVRTFIGQENLFTTRLLVVVPVVAVTAGLLSVVFCPLGRWCLRLQRQPWKVPTE
jgi:rod shape-determining protein MreD